MSQQVRGSKLSRRQFLQSSVAFGAAVGLFALAGCAPPAGAPAASGGAAAAPAAAGKKILYWKPPHSANEADLWKPLLKKFMDANAGITVEHQVIPWGSVDAQFTAAFAGGSPPDVFYLPDEWYPKYVKQNQISDLTDKIGSWKDQYSPAAWGIATYKGKVWGSPFLGVVQGWLINMTLFKSKGLKAPTNWEEFRNAAKALTDTAAGTYGFAASASSPTNWVQLVPLLATGGAKLLSDDLMKMTANTEGGVAAFKALLEDMVWTDKSSNPVGFTDQQILDLSFKGKFGMVWVEESGIKAQWRKQAPDLELDVIPMLKLTDKGQNADWANVGFMFMAQNSKDKDSAFKLIEYLSTDDIQTEYVQKGVDLLPLKKAIKPMADVDPIVAKMIGYLDAGNGVGTQISIHWREACNSLVQEGQAVMSGQKTAQKALADVEATVNAILDGE